MEKLSPQLYAHISRFLIFFHPSFTYFPISKLNSVDRHGCHPHPFFPPINRLILLPLVESVQDQGKSLLKSLLLRLHSLFFITISSISHATLCNFFLFLNLLQASLLICFCPQADTTLNFYLSQFIFHFCTTFLSRFNYSIILKPNFPQCFLSSRC